MNQDWIVQGVDLVMAQAVATGLFRSLCTVKAPDGTLGAGGAPSGTYVAVAGLSGIVAMDAPAPEQVGPISGSESKSLADVLSLSARHVLLDSYYPLLSPSTNWGDVGWIAEMTDRTGNVTVYDITGADADSQQTQSRLRLQKVRT